MEDRLKKFAKLIDAGSYTRAAKVLHTSQPALTTAVQKLERELKSELVVKGSRPLQATAAGQIAYSHGHMLLVHEDNLWNRLHELEERKRPLRIGSIDSLADIIIRDKLLDILERDSLVSLTIHNTSELVVQLQKGELDLVLVVQTDELAAQWQTQTLGEERFTLVCSQESTEIYEAAIRERTLPHFLAYNAGSNTEALIRKQLERNKLRIEAEFHSTNPAVLLALAKQGKGVSALPYRLVERDLGKKLAELPLKKPIVRPIVAAWQPDRQLPASLEDFLDTLEIQLV